MSPRSFGIEGITDEDRAYGGSRFSVVREALLANPYQRTWGARGEPPLPVHPVTLSSLLYGILPFGPPYLFRQATERAVDSAADLRWGPERKGFRRLVHPNGICLTGLWQITEDTGYSGYFRNGSRALVVGRYSTCCRETRRGHVRSLSLVGKLFPTVEPDHIAPLRTASFITQQDIGGDYDDYINDVELLNAPNTTALRRGFGMGILAVFGIMLSVVDTRPTMRQLYQVAELGKAQGEPTRAPTFMRLTVAPDQPRIEGAGLDFRDSWRRFTIAATSDRNARSRSTSTLPMTGRRTARRSASDAPSGIGAASEQSPSTRRSFHTMAISSSISVIRRGVTTKTIPQPPPASTDERCAEIIARVPKRRHPSAERLRCSNLRRNCCCYRGPRAQRTASITGSPNGQDYRRMIAPRIYPICLTRLRWPQRSPPRGRHSITANASREAD